MKLAIMKLRAHEVRDDVADVIVERLVTRLPRLDRVTIGAVRQR